MLGGLFGLFFQGVQKGCAFHIHIRNELIKPLRHPPGFIAQQGQHCGGDGHADHEGIHQHAEGQAEADGADHCGFGEDEPAEHRDHNDHGGDHHTHRMVVPGDNSGFRAFTVHIGFAHARDQEHLVVHRQPEENTDHQGGQERQDRTGVVHPEEGPHEAHLVHCNHRTEARQNREEEPDRSNQGYQNRAEHQNQHNKR